MNFLEISNSDLSESFDLNIPKNVFVLQIFRKLVNFQKLSIQKFEKIVDFIYQKCSFILHKNYVPKCLLKNNLLGRYFKKSPHKVLDINCQKKSKNFRQFCRISVD